MITRRSFTRGMAIAGFGLTADAACAQDFPARPVTLIVSVQAGTSADACLRALAAATEKHLGRPIIIENRAGASTTLAAQMVARVSADGYTLAQIGQTAWRFSFLRKTTYDPAIDFTYIIAVTGYTYGVVVKSDAPWKTFQEFLADANTNPGKITYGTGGPNTNGHILMEWIAKQRGIKWVHIPFKGGDATNALLGGHIDAQADPAGWAPQVNASNLRLLVTGGARRTKTWPTVPTLQETGIDRVASSVYGIAGPKGMAPKIVKVLHDALRKGMEDPFFIKTIAQFDQEVLYLNSADYHDFAIEQIAEEKRLVDELKLKDE